MGRPLGRAIGSREFTAAGPRGPIRIMVRIGLPYRRRTGEWACPFQVKGAGPQRIKEALGIDAFQALHLVFQGVRTELESKKYGVTWLGVDLDTVLPRSVPAFGDTAFTARLNRLIDREMSKYDRAGHARLVKLAKTDKRWLPAVKASARGRREMKLKRYLD